MSQNGSFTNIKSIHIDYTLFMSISLSILSLKLSMTMGTLYLKYKFGNRHFWAEGYYVSTLGLNEATIKKYIQEQEKHDIALDKLSIKEYEDPFKGSK